MSDIEIYAVGMVYMSVCAKNSIPIDAIVLEANRKHPTGIEQPWALSSDKTFHKGKSNPCQCDKEPGRTHYLLSC